MKRALIVTGLTLGLLTATVGTAWADSVDTAIDELRNTPVYVDPAATLEVDENAVTDAIGSHQMRVALLPPDAGSPTSVIGRLHEEIGAGTYVVFVGQQVAAASEDLPPGSADRGATDAVAANSADIASGDATSSLVDMVTRFDEAARAGAGQEQGQGQGQEPERNAVPNRTAPAKESGGGGTVLLVILGIAVVGIVGAVVWSRRRKRKAQEKLIAERRAEIMPLYDRLANDVSTISPGGDEVAQQALADASERFTSTGAKLATAKTDADFDACHRTVVEGLYAARTARTALGLDPGPELPSPSTAGDRLTGPGEVTVNGQTYQGYPDYQPGAPNYYPGGNGYGAGWYSFPFWETMLIGSMMTGGFGAFGGWGGGGFGHGYESGYDQGMDDATDQMDSGGGEGGDFGGGDFGGDFGGGDFGGDFGGGDFGGGDFGGGDW